MKTGDYVRTEEEILGAFLLVNDYRILTNEELEDVKKAINNLQQENVKLKQQLKDKDEKISKVIEYCLNEREDINGSKCDDILEILESNKED
jgi:SepF-like predicted cell division protein (DUF552 family)